MTGTGQHKVGLTISDADARGVLSFDLRDVLGLVPQSETDSAWEVSGAEAVGPSARDLHDASDAEVRLSHRRLCEIAAGLKQTLGGEFRSFRAGEPEPWLVVRAVDSSVFDVISSDPALIELVRRRFEHVREYPPSEL